VLFKILSEIQLHEKKMVSISACLNNEIGFLDFNLFEQENLKENIPLNKI